MLTRDAILAATSIRREVVEVPEWGGQVLVRGLTGTERDQLEAGTLKGIGKNAQADMRNFRARLAALSICDETGKRLFSDSDIAALGQTSAAALDRVADAAMRLSGIKAEAVEDAEKN